MMSLPEDRRSIGTIHRSIELAPVMPVMIGSSDLPNLGLPAC